MFDCHFLTRYDPKKRLKKRLDFEHRFELTMELGDTSDEEASPPQPKKREMSKNQSIQMVLMLQMLQTEDSMRRGAFTIVDECFGMAHLMVHCLWNRVARTCTSGHIISLEFHSHKNNSGRWPILEFFVQPT